MTISRLASADLPSTSKRIRYESGVKFATANPSCGGPPQCKVPPRRRDERVQAKLEELGALAEKSQRSVWEVLREFAGKAKGLPPDFATNHDYYLYGLPKRKV